MPWYVQREARQESGSSWSASVVGMNLKRINRAIRLNKEIRSIYTWPGIWTSTRLHLLLLTMYCGSSPCWLVVPGTLHPQQRWSWMALLIGTWFIAVNNRALMLLLLIWNMHGLPLISPPQMRRGSGSYTSQSVARDRLTTTTVYLCIEWWGN